MVHAVWLVSITGVWLNTVHALLVILSFFSFLMWIFTDIAFSHHATAVAVSSPNMTGTLLNGDNP